MPVVFSEQCPRPDCTTCDSHRASLLPLLKYKAANSNNILTGCRTVSSSWRRYVQLQLYVQSGAWKRLGSGLILSYWVVGSARLITRTQHERWLAGPCGS